MTIGKPISAIVCVTANVGEADELNEREDRNVRLAYLVPHI